MSNIMLTRKYRTSLARILWLLLVIAPLTGCSQHVFGSIPPSTFQFTTVVPHDGVGAGGWQIAQVVVLLGRLSAMFPRAAVCEIEVGTPLINSRQGRITTQKAQIESARAADSAAHKLLGERVTPTASACTLFRKTMRDFLERAIHGAKVGSFLEWPGKEPPRKTFPPRRGQ